MVWKKKMMIVIGVLLLIGAAVTVSFYINYNHQSEYRQKIKIGERYLKEKAYEKAEDVYLEAIKLDPRQAEAYENLSEVYLSQERYEDAVNILEKGQKKCEKQKLQKQYNKVYPYYGFSNYLCTDLKSQDGIVTNGERDSVSGLVSSFLMDTARDASPRLVTFCFSGDEMPGSFDIEEYDCEDTEISQIDEVLYSSGESLYDQNESTVFKKEYKGNTYIVVIKKGQTNTGIEQDVNIFSVAQDGITQEDSLQVLGHFSASDITCSMMINGESVAEPSRSEIIYDDCDGFYVDESEGEVSDDYADEVKRGKEAFRSCLGRYGLEVLVQEDEMNGDSPLLNEYAQDQKTETILFTYTLERDSMDSDTFRFTFKDYTDLEKRVNE